ncbi:MAG: SufD family Fe-S cluster assembly protein [Ruminococcaceae bacterium]|nr:SufD family Fe-S cluster assembly protein [Oscillospiraceae bacterium]
MLTLSNFTGYEQELLEAVSDLHEIPEGAYNIRRNGASMSRNSTEEIEIVPKTDKSGIDIIVKAGVKNRSVHIPVIITESGLSDLVYNDFFIGEDADVLIVAGCGIHNDGSSDSRHDGIHTFHIGKNAHVKYVEKHYGSGNGKGGRILNPVTELYLDENASCELESVQIKGVDSTVRTTRAYLEKDAKLLVMERLMTHGEQKADSDMTVELNGENAGARIISRSVAKDSSVQMFHPIAAGNSKCRAHIQCDSIIMDNAKVSSIPEIAANHSEAEIVHEAAIGRINNDQLLKLQTLGLSEQEAEEIIVEGFLR